MNHYIPSMRRNTDVSIYIGETWKIKHSVKGTFIIKIKTISHEFLNGTIVEGEHPSPFTNQQKGKGDFIRLTRNLITDYQRIKGL